MKEPRFYRNICYEVMVLFAFMQRALPVNRRVHRKGSLHECEQNHHLIANIAVEPWFFHLLRTTSRDLRRSHEPPQTVAATVNLFWRIATEIYNLGEFQSLL